MRIGLDASRATVAHRTGTESYALNLIRGLLAAQPAHDWLLYFRDPPAPGVFPTGTPRIIPFPRAWTHARLSLELFLSPRPDVLFIPAHVLPLIHPLPTVVTIHDLGYLRFPQAHPFSQRLYLDLSTRFSARAATHLLADSLATKNDLVHFCHTPPDKITVVYPGRDETLTRVDPAHLRAKYNLPDHYLLHVGTLQPRKNISRLIEVFSLQPSSFSLVLAGKPGWLSAPLLAAARQHPHIRVLDYVPDDDLQGLYSGATAFVFPSLYEGFGFPILEAMACGVPVITSNTSSCPEVAGDAALLVDPTDTSALASALTRLLSDADLRAALIAKGYEQIKKFSWTRAARETLSVLEKVARG
jgi:glycosyltransferase involved in cell wall biosynthesis